jgi:hypothetical protein
MVVRIKIGRGEKKALMVRSNLSLTTARTSHCCRLRLIIDIHHVVAVGKTFLKDESF